LTKEESFKIDNPNMNT